MQFDDTLAGGQTDAGAFVLADAVQALENAEHPFTLVVGDADAIIGDGDAP